MIGRLLLIGLLAIPFFINRLLLAAIVYRDSSGGSLMDQATEILLFDGPYRMLRRSPLGRCNFLNLFPWLHESPGGGTGVTCASTGHFQRKLDSFRSASLEKLASF